MNLVTNTKKNNNHKKILCRLLKWSENCILCTSFFDERGLNHILPTIKEGLEDRRLSVKIFSNGEKEYTKSKVIETLASIEGIEHIVHKTGKRLHSKIYYFEKENSFIAIIGSANLTHNGLIKNEELSVQVEGEVGSAEHFEVSKYFTHLDSLK